MSLGEALEKAGWSDVDLQWALFTPPKQQRLHGESAVIDLVSPSPPSAAGETPCIRSLGNQTYEANRKKNGRHIPLDQTLDPYENMDRLTLKTGDKCLLKSTDVENIPQNGIAHEVFRRKLNLLPSNTFASRTSANDESLLSTIDLDKPLPNGWTLYKHQRDAVTCCIKQKRSILAYDMGLGKTIICLLWAKAFQLTYPCCLIVIISPCTLLENWRKEAMLIGLMGGETSNKSVRLFSWAKIPTPGSLLTKTFENFVLICDEAHAMQTLKSARTQSALSLCQSPYCIGAILATGTPMKNGRPANLYPLLLGIRHSIAANKVEFEKRYCNARKTKFCAWDITGASNLTELRTLIGPQLLRKTKEECIEDICSLRRLKLNAEVTEQAMIDYEALINVMKSVKSQHKPGKSALEHVTELRQLMSIAKVPATVRHLQEQLNIEASPIVVFVWFRETVMAIREEFTNCSTVKIDGRRAICDFITGDITDYVDRQRIVDRFQEGEIDVLVLTYGVGSTGLTLTKSHRVVLLDRPWTPGDVVQAEDRVRRIGQAASEVTSTWVSAFLYDDLLDRLLLSKDKKNAQVIGGEIPYFSMHHCGKNNSNLAGKQALNLACKSLHVSFKQSKMTEFTAFTALSTGFQHQASGADQPITKRLKQQFLDWNKCNGNDEEDFDSYKASLINPIIDELSTVSGLEQMQWQ